jgi:hypothetical protein
MTGAPPTVEFFSIYTDAPLPAPASADLMGAMPVRAAQFCVPLEAASGLGFYVYPPTDVGVRWDGQRSDVSWLDAHGRTSRGTYASASRRAERTDRCPYADTPAGA